MAVFQGTIRSSILANDTQLQVILPYDRPVENQQVPCKVLYLLHGLGENSQAWCRYTTIERLARKYGIAVIMPEVQRSFYTDMVYGSKYFTYVTEELPQLCGSMFHISPARNDTFIAGLSMGGYGALKCALTYPEQYAAVGSFSGAVDLQDIVSNYLTDDTIGEFIGAFGATPQVLLPENDLFSLAENLANTSSSLKIFLTCGQQDFLLPMNQRFHQHLQSLSLQNVKFESWPGNHEWDFWQTSVEKALGIFI